MTLKEWLDPRKRPWWRKSEWISQEMFGVFEIQEKHEGCSWDVGTFTARLYKHKKTCEERIRVDRSFVGNHTVFEEPEKHFEGMVNVENLEVYEGPKYE